MGIFVYNMESNKEMISNSTRKGLRVSKLEYDYILQVSLLIVQVVKCFCVFEHIHKRVCFDK